MKKAKFIVFEGIDGSGKSTISNMLFEKINSQIGNVYKTFEPTDSPIGSVIKNILNRRIISDDKTIGALFLADRLDHIQNPITGMLNYLNKGKHVISDRYYYSSYAYHVPMLSMDWVINANKACADLLRPDIVFYFDISIDESMRRLSSSRTFLDLFETREKMEQVMLNYRKAIKREGKKDNVVVIDGEREVTEIFDEVWGITSKLLEIKSDDKEKESNEIDHIVE
ncbi:MAG: dTMP kinase [Bacteroidota bacterium]